jgi:uroporphyrin-III C-methyltransferase
MTIVVVKPFLDQMVMWFQSALHAARTGRSFPLPQALERKRRQGFVSLVGAGPGSADLITLRGLQRLKAADVIFYDRLADPALLTHKSRRAIAVYVGKAPGCHAVPQAQINALLVQAAQSGQQVVRLKCGDPGIFARGAEEADALTAAGIGWEIVPGVTSATAAAASARSFLTERGETEFLVLATGHSRPGASHDWQGTARPGTTLACYMGVAQSSALAGGLQNAGWPAACAVEVVSRAQTSTEKIFHCRLDGLSALCAAQPDLSPAMLIIRWPLSVGGALPVASSQPQPSKTVPA